MQRSFQCHSSSKTARTYGNKVFEHETQMSKTLMLIFAQSKAFGHILSFLWLRWMAFAFAFNYSYAIWWTNSKEKQHEHLFSCFFRISQLLINSKNVILMPFSHSDAIPWTAITSRLYGNKLNKTSIFGFGGSINQSHS